MTNKIIRSHKEICIFGTEFCSWFYPSEDEFGYGLGYYCDRFNCFLREAPKRCPKCVEKFPLGFEKEV